MKAFYSLRPYALAAMLVSGSTFSAEPLDPTSSVDEAVARVQVQKVSAYREMLQLFDAAIHAAPDDVALVVRRCEFINAFTDEDYGDWVDSAPEDFEACQSELQELFPDAPEVHLFSLDQVWGQPGRELGESLIEKSESWPDPMRQRVLARVSELYQGADAQRAGELALMASNLGDESQASTAIEYLAASQKYEEAANLLARIGPSSNEWEASQRIEAALSLPDGAVALAELRRYDAADFEIDKAMAGRVHLHSGDIDKAAQLLNESGNQFGPVNQARFDVALASGAHADAARLVDLTQADAFKDNANRFLTLLKHSPGTIRMPSMMMGMFLCLVVVFAFLICPGVLLVPAHYVGLFRRARGKFTGFILFESVGLRHAWIALSVALVVPLLVGVAVEPSLTIDLFSGEASKDAQGMFRVMIWGSAAELMLCLVLARSMGIDRLVGVNATLRSIGWVVLGWLSLIALGVLLTLLNGGSGVSGSEPGHREMIATMVQGGRELVGPLGTLLVFALLVPVAEELTFRGLVLGGLSRHIGFGWANFAQASVFALFHDDLARLPYFLLMGLIAGWLVRRYRALGPAILLHALNNAVATGLKLF